ncbi:MAG: DUF1294 domain-containing protein [Ruminococcaceae bacterium]|nr:DUF1294 domain-containing protein [Oscillospiraceae bacterium]
MNMQYYIFYFLAVSVASVIFTVYDKRCAVKGKRRISEKTLFLFALLGGALAMYITMKCIRHKTLHKRFMIGLPAIFIMHTAIIFGYFYIKNQY